MYQTRRGESALEIIERIFRRRNKVYGFLGGSGQWIGVYAEKSS